MYARRRPRPSPREAKVVPWKAPVGGLIANRNLATPKGPDGREAPGACVLENWFPTARGAVMRRGSEVYATIPEQGGNDSFTKVLLHMDGYDGSTTFTDSNVGGSAHTWTAFGDAQIDTAQWVFGGASGLFDGTGDYISTPDHADFTLGSSDFTIDLWFYCNAPAGSARGLFCHSDGSGAAAGTSFEIRRGVSNTIIAALSTGTTLTQIATTSTYTDAVNTGWHHLAFVRSGDVLTLYIDGVSVGTAAFTGSVLDVSNVLTVGGRVSGAISWMGWLDEVRLSVGTARWTANFTPPTVPYAVPEPNDVEEFLTYTVGGQEDFFAATEESIYDISLPSSPEAVVTGLSGSDWVYTQFATSGGTFLVAVNGLDRLHIYDGTYWYPIGSTNLYTLPYDTGTAPFPIGATVTGGTSGATGVVRNKVGNAGAGVLIIDTLASGPFQNDEALTGGGGSAIVDGTETLRLAGLTGIATTNFSYVWAFKNRLFFVEKNSLSMWYLAVDAITGAATEYPLGGIFTLGGSLLFGSGWSIESADGLDARCVVVTDGGEEGAEVAVFAGIDPSDADLWSLIGVYRTGKPMGRKAHVRAGGDLVIATDIGAIPLSVAIQRDYAALAPSALSFPIEDEWAREVTRRSQEPWKCKTWPTGRMTVVALPTIEGEVSRWFVANVRTGAWTVFTGWDAACVAVYDDRLFFGSSAGRVVEANVTGFDEGATYTATFVPLFDDLRSPASLKVPSLARAVLLAPVDVDTTLEMLADFVLDLPPAPPATPVPPGSTWGTGKWDEMIWGEEQSAMIVQEWVSVGREGYALAPALLLTSGSQQPLDAEIVRIESTHTVAEVVT